MKPGLIELERYRAEIEALCRKYGVKELRVFGSALRDDWDPERSDFDFAAVFDECPADMSLFLQRFGLSADLEKVVGRPVDLLDLATARKSSLREHIHAKGHELYVA
jgi:predicted nucleotidyltransferase